MAETKAKTATQKAADAKRTIQQRVFAARQNMEKLARTTAGQVGSHKYNYVTHENVIDACLSQLAAEGVYLEQVGRIHDGEQTVVTYLVNVDDPSDFTFSEFYIPRLTDPQKLGGWFTYLKKYELKGQLGLPDTDDDDGASASGVNAGNTQQAKEANFKPGVHEVVPTYVKKVKEATDGSWTLFAIGTKDGEFTTFERDVANAVHAAIADGEVLNIKFEEKKGRVNATHVVS